jgi:hypothetical protein
LSTKPPKRGDLVRVDWLDIYENATGNPDEAKLARRSTFGLYWEKRTDEGVRVLVTTTTVDEEGHWQVGYSIYPLACVVKLAVIKRGAATA